MASPSAAIPDGREVVRSGSAKRAQGSSPPADKLTEPTETRDGSGPGLDEPVLSVAPIIRSKIEPPQLRSSTLSRGRLLEALSKAITQRVTLVTAEAGYGKTTLLTDFSSRPFARCLWYKLDSTDRDWITLVNYVVAAVREMEPGFAERTLHLLSADPTSMAPREAVLGSLMAELNALPDGPTVLILDDLHAIDESQEACDVITRVIRDAPPGFRFVLSSRRRPPLLLARLAGMGELSELVTDDLRFSREETERLFAESYGRPLAPDVLEEIDQRTKGWAATLQLVHSSIRGKSDSAVRSLAHSISGGEGRLYDFLAEEVLSLLPAPLQDFVIRTSLLPVILAEYVMALFDEGLQPSRQVAQAWIEEADALGILSRTSQSSAVRQFHPLFREFLLRQLDQRYPPDAVRAMHGRVARAAVVRDPLLACHHYIEADEMTEAMHCLAASAVLTMGSGRWGTASELIGRLHDVPAEPVVAAIQARRLLEDGDVAAAAAMLAEIDVTHEPPAVRAVFRHTQLSLGWRSRDSEALFATLREIEQDSETPPLLREIAQVFVDSSPLSAKPVPFPALSQRLQRMAERQAQSGHTYHAAISLHNAAIAELNAARYREAIRLATVALDSFASIGQAYSDSYSTNALLATCAFELGLVEQGEEDIRAALASGRERGDVHADCAFSLATMGQLERASRLLITADALERQGRSDLAGAAVAGFARSLLFMASDPETALSVLGTITTRMPLDVGFDLDRRMLLALAHLLRGAREESIRVADAAMVAARGQNGTRCEARLALILALARENESELRLAISQASNAGQLALLQVADAIGRSLWLLTDVPLELTESIAKWKDRWLPVLRKQLEAGDTANARAAALLLNEHGALHDVGILRAYEKTYLRRGKALGLGRSLAHRVSPVLEIHDLGRVMIQVGVRLIPLTRIRRKPAALLMYLATRPALTAPREQVLDELWPDADPVSASNSLNQTLYFLRREIDPWYEDDVSADYVSFESDLLWLDSDLVRVASARFVAQARSMMSDAITAHEAVAFLDAYPGQFCPEFEYEEWAISWRSRAHAAYLSFAHSTCGRLINQGDFRGARDVALRVLSIDPDALDIERILIWLYSRLGNRSAAAAQYQHLLAREQADGLVPPSLTELTGGNRPPSL